MCENEEQYVYADVAEYPPVRVHEKNPDYAKAMLSNVGACNSEISAVTSYFYNSIIMDAPYAEVGKVFHKISIVEMHHLRIYGELARMLGADPRLWSVKRGKLTYWTPGCNQYPRKLDEILKTSYQAEKKTIEKYEWQIRHIDDDNIRENLDRIILDEKCHLVLLDQLYEKYC